MYLLDTNIWLERLLNQARSEEVGQFLGVIPADELFITVFSFHSIGVILSRMGLQDLLLRFVQDAFIDGAVELLSLQPEAMQDIVDVMAAYHLDFDDAYQYVIAEQYDLVLVSFDHDFDRTDRARTTPADVLASRPDS